MDWKKLALEQAILLEQQRDEIAMLKEEIARLKKNSGNSSKPPSSDLVKPPKTKSMRPSNSNSNLVPNAAANCKRRTARQECDGILEILYGRIDSWSFSAKFAERLILNDLPFSKPLR
jgi:hypothetical protein